MFSAEVHHFLLTKKALLSLVCFEMEEVPPFQHLIRFLDVEGRENYGDLQAYRAGEAIEGTYVRVLSGDLNTGFSATSVEKEVRKVQGSICSKLIANSV